MKGERMLSLTGHPSGTPWALQLSLPATLYDIKLDSMIFDFLLHFLQNSKLIWKHHETQMAHNQNGASTCRSVAASSRAVVSRSESKRRHSTASGSQKCKGNAYGSRSLMQFVQTDTLSSIQHWNIRLTSLKLLMSMGLIDQKTIDHQTSLHRQRHPLLPFGSAFAQGNNHEPY